MEEFPEHSQPQPEANTYEIWHEESTTVSTECIRKKTKLIIHIAFNTIKSGELNLSSARNITFRTPVLMTADHI